MSPPSTQRRWPAGSRGAIVHALVLTLRERLSPAGGIQITAIGALRSRLLTLDD